MSEKIEKQANLIQQAKAEVAREIFGEVDHHVFMSNDIIGSRTYIRFAFEEEGWQSLKSKYTGGQSE